MENVNERLRRTVQILENAGVPYAVVGGHAVRAWVAQVDIAAVRTTLDVDILARPADFPRIAEAMTKAGFHHRQTSGLDMFVEHPEASARDAVHVLYAGQRVRDSDYEPNPDLESITGTDDFRTVPLETLVRMKLNSFRDKDRVHLRDMISVGLLDARWLDRFPRELSARLKDLLDHPDG